MSVWDPLWVYVIDVKKMYKKLTHAMHVKDISLHIYYIYIILYIIYIICKTYIYRYANGTFID